MTDEPKKEEEEKVMVTVKDACVYLPKSIAEIHNAEYWNEMSRDTASLYNMLHDRIYDSVSEKESIERSIDRAEVRIANILNAKIRDEYGDEIAEKTAEIMKSEVVGPEELETTGKKSDLELREELRKNLYRDPIGKFAVNGKLISEDLKRNGIDKDVFHGVSYEKNGEPVIRYYGSRETLEEIKKVQGSSHNREMTPVEPDEAETLFFSAMGEIFKRNPGLLTIQKEYDAKKLLTTKQEESKDE